MSNNSNGFSLIDLLLQEDPNWQPADEDRALFEEVKATMVAAPVEEPAATEEVVAPVTEEVVEEAVEETVEEAPVTEEEVAPETEKSEEEDTDADAGGDW